MNIRQNKLWLWGGIAIIAIILLTVITAPNSNKLMAGSTYSKDPNGYGAWYEYMSEKGYNIQRWQKPFQSLINNSQPKANTSKITYIQIYPAIVPTANSKSQASKWLKEGNQLIVLGAREPASKAPFISNQSYNNLQIKIKTTRRKEIENITDPLLQDDYGVIAWRQKIQKGEIIYLVSPYVGANAYQKVADNYQFLAQLIDRENQILIDEYIHGYKDIETKKTENKATLTDYFYKTIWLPLGIQSLFILEIYLIFSLRRFGRMQKIIATETDNSQAYIEALAGVLEKAEATDFIVQTIHKDEQIKLQKKLGLGRKILASDVLVKEWSKQTSNSPEKLQQLLKRSEDKQHISQSNLVKWLQSWQKINQEKNDFS